MGETHQAEEERLGTEIRILNEKLESINIPVTFLPLSPASSNASNNQRVSALSELELELQCCSCGQICSPPTKIYQCSDGDLLCDNCRADPTLETCPVCNIPLAGQTSRNKVL